VPRRSRSHPARKIAGKAFPDLTWNIGDTRCACARVYVRPTWVSCAENVSAYMVGATIGHEDDGAGKTNPNGGVLFLLGSSRLSLVSVSFICVHVKKRLGTHAACPFVRGTRGYEIFNRHASIIGFSLKHREHVGGMRVI